MYFADFCSLFSVSRQAYTCVILKNISTDMRERDRKRVCNKK
jgi:hypothetical protein